jgi:hypothetical protein
MITITSNAGMVTITIGRWNGTAVTTGTVTITGTSNASAAAAR